mgnify:CR=1 FL=1
MKRITIENDEHRRVLRRQHVGSSEIAMLFDASPYATRFMLWHDKAGTAPLPEPEGARIDWGTLLEPVIAAGVAREMRWQVEKFRAYAAHDDVEGWGCSIDYHVTDHEAGPGIVECKNVDWLRWRQEWSETRAPLHIELQLQHQLGASGYAWGAIAVLIGGNELRIYERQPEPKALREIEAAIVAFWASVRAGKAPDPFGAPVENETIRSLWPVIEPEKVVDLTGDEEAAELARQFAWAHQQMQAHQPIREASRVKLLARIGDAGRVVMPGARIKVSRRRALTVEIVDEAAMEASFADPSFPMI